MKLVLERELTAAGAGAGGGMKLRFDAVPAAEAAVAPTSLADQVKAGLEALRRPAPSAPPAERREPLAGLGTTLRGWGEQARQRWEERKPKKKPAVAEPAVPVAGEEAAPVAKRRLEIKVPHVDIGGFLKKVGDGIPGALEAAKKFVSRPEVAYPLTAVGSAATRVALARLTNADLRTVDMFMGLGVGTVFGVGGRATIQALEVAAQRTARFPRVNRLLIRASEMAHNKALVRATEYAAVAGLGWGAGAAISSRFIEPRPQSLPKELEKEVTPSAAPTRTETPKAATVTPTPTGTPIPEATATVTPPATPQPKMEVGAFLRPEPPPISQPPTGEVVAPQPSAGLGVGLGGERMPYHPPSAPPPPRPPSPPAAHVPGGEPDYLRPPYSPEPPLKPAAVGSIATITPDAPTFGHALSIDDKALGGGNWVNPETGKSHADVVRDMTIKLARANGHNIDVVQPGQRIEVEKMLSKEQWEVVQEAIKAPNLAHYLDKVRPLFLRLLGR